MPSRRLRAIVLAWLLTAPAGAAAAQEALPVFTGVPAGARSASAQAASRALAARQDLPVAARQYAGMRLDRVFAGPAGAARLALNLFGQVLYADLVRVDVDASGHRSWVGIVSGQPDSHVVLTERAGVVSGVIGTASATYQVRTVGDGLYALELVDRGALGAELPPLEPPPAPGPAAAASASASPEGDGGGVIDVLLLYTPAMRAAAGGTAQVAALASQIISDTNTAYQQSGVAVVVRLAASVEIAFTESPSSMSSDLLAVTSSATAASYRDQVGADLVQLLVHSPSTSSCGVGWLMTQGLFGPQFAPNAFSVADWRCAAQYTPTHEMGHNEGSHHAPEDGASGALFSYSYGYKSSSGAFRSVMAYACAFGAGCPRVLRFSNPGVAYLGEVTGTSSQNNALSISQAASTVANFRQAVSPVPAPSPAPRPGTTPPSAPTGLQSVVNGSAVTLSWTAVTDPAAPATSYKVEVGTAPGTLNLASQVVGNVTTVSGQVGLGLYYWRVFGMNAAGLSPASAEAQFAVVSGGGCFAPPSPPRSFSFSVSGRLVTLHWLAPAAGVPTTYVVEAGSASGLADLYNQAVGAVLAVQVQAPPGSYFVRIRAANACGTSSPSNEAFINVP